MAYAAVAAGNAVVTLPTPGAGHSWRIIKMMATCDGTAIAAPGIFISVANVVSSIDTGGGSFSYLFRVRVLGQSAGFQINFDTYGDPKLALNCVVGQAVTCTFDVSTVTTPGAAVTLVVWAELI